LREKDLASPLRVNSAKNLGSSETNNCRDPSPAKKNGGLRMTLPSQEAMVKP
jgi:hypothetical protein